MKMYPTFRVPALVSWLFQKAINKMLSLFQIYRVRNYVHVLLPNKARAVGGNANLIDLLTSFSELPFLLELKNNGKKIILKVKLNFANKHT